MFEIFLFIATQFYCYPFFAWRIGTNEYPLQFYKFSGTIAYSVEGFLDTIAKDIAQFSKAFNFSQRTDFFAPVTLSTSIPKKPVRVASQ